VFGPEDLRRGAAGAEAGGNGRERSDDENGSGYDHGKLRVGRIMLVADGGPEGEPPTNAEHGAGEGGEHLRG
jgi:hypothetical protein